MNDSGKLRAVRGACLAVSALASTVASAAGNGAPSGAHYNLNIIGVEKGKTSPT